MISTMRAMRGRHVGKQALTRGVGMGSRQQVEALALVTSLVTKGTSTGEKEEKQDSSGRVVGGAAARGWGERGRGGK